MTEECFVVCSPLQTNLCWTECLTGDMGCPCFDRSHCQGACVNRTSDTCGGEVLDGECAVADPYYMVGCHCYVERGVLEEVCYQTTMGI